MTPKELANEIEVVLSTTPPLATRRHETPENQAWLGRAANAIHQWDPTRSAAFSGLLKQFHSSLARESGEAFQQITVLLNQAQYDLRLATSKQGSDGKGENTGPVHPELVFVIHGRQLRGNFHAFLRAIGLKPLEWSEARRRTGKPNPYTWEIVDLALKDAGAIVALLTPDDEARLRQHLWEPNENATEKQYLAQPRQNVLFEAGVAYGRNPERTILLRVGSHRPMSDLSGHHIVELNDSPQSRQEVADALRAAGCPVDLSGTDWYKEGKFNLPELSPASIIDPIQARKDSGTLRLQQIAIKGSQDLQGAANAVVEVHIFFETHPDYLNEANEAFLQKYPRDLRQQLAFNSREALKRWSLPELQADADLLTIG